MVDRRLWICWKKEKGEPVTERIPKNAVINKVTFTKSMRLSSTLKADLMHLYANTELI